MKRSDTQGGGHEPQGTWRRIAGGGLPGTRRVAFTAVMIGAMIAGTGTVLAASGGGAAGGSAAEAQYRTEKIGPGPCVIITEGDNYGDNNCDNTTINNTYPTTIVMGPQTTPAPTTTPATTTPATTETTPEGTGEVKGYNAESGPKYSNRHILIHLNTRHRKIRWVKVRINGVIKSWRHGKHASPYIRIIDPPCYQGTTSVVVTGKLGNGKTVQAIHYYHLCVAGVGRVTSPDEAT